jgi:hypothetical protein
MGVVLPRGDRLLRSGWGRGRLFRLRGRNCPSTATGRWRRWESIVSAVADAVVVPFRRARTAVVIVGVGEAFPLVPVRPVGVLLPVAYFDGVSGADTGIPLPAWAVVLRQVRLVRVWRISVGNRSTRRNRRNAAQHGRANPDFAWIVVSVGV